jgi:hypothetical protein
MLNCKMLCHPGVHPIDVKTGLPSGNGPCPCYNCGGCEAFVFDKKSQSSANAAAAEAAGRLWLSGRDRAL